MEAAIVAKDELSPIAAFFGNPGACEVLLADDVAVPMTDGTTLRATVALPRQEQPAPAVLIRTPYGRKLFTPEAMYWASHGYAAIVQDTRSTTSYFSEAEDGAATVRWIERQAWFNGRLGLSGPSYMAFAAWATASTRPACLRALAISVYSTDRTSAWYPGGTLNLELALSWSATQEGARADGTNDDAGPYMRLPLGEADIASVGETMPFYQERLRYWADDPHWAPLNMARVAETIEVPVLHVDGWHDYHRVYCFQDFERIGRAGAPRRLVIGPWTHMVDSKIVMAENLAWFDTYLKGDGTVRMPEIRWYRTGATQGWHDLDTWATPAEEVLFHADAAGALTTKPGVSTITVGWTYDPADPTPSVGLTVFGGLDVGGAVDNRELAARADVRVFTSAPLDEPLETLGRVTAKARFFSDAASADLFVRVLDVEPGGRSLNVCEGTVRRTGPELASGCEVELDLGPVAHTFGTGHSVQVMVSSGAHPFFARNLGTGEPALTATQIVTARQALCVGGGDGLRISLPRTGVVRP